MTRTMHKHLGKLLLTASLGLFWVTSPACAERPEAGNPYAYIVQLGQMGFAQGGGVFLPTTVLQAMRTGNLSLISQYVLVNSMFNQCIKDVKKYTPEPTDPFTVARSKFQYGMCRITACQKQGLLMLALPLLSSNPAAGGAGSSADASANMHFTAALAQAFANSQSCGGQGPAIDPALIQLASAQ